MHYRQQHGFILPFALLLSAAILAFAVLLLKMELAALARTEARLLHQRASNTLRLNAAPLVESVARQVMAGEGASALLRDPLKPGAPLRPVWQTAAAPAPLHSAAGAHPERRPTAFQSPVSPQRLAADWIALGPPDAVPRLALAWAAEDIVLLAADAPAPDFWPLPAWNLAPAPASAEALDLLDQATDGQWRSLPWFPAGEPLPLAWETSPALVPVVRRLALRFGIFAAGHPSRPGKTVRVRFYFSGELWNPYNRPLRLHSGSALRSLFQVVVYNLPEVRLHNRSLGVSSDWIPLDAAQNAGSGVEGLHAWIRAPGEIGPGGRHAFFEPDPGRQPEGLARTLHTAFGVGPADRIEVELRQPPGGLYAACLPLGDADPLGAALAGHGWLRLEAFPAAWPQLVYPRAAAGPQPFLLETGSLSFRLDDARLQAAFSEPASLAGAGLDPRRRVVRHAQLFADAAGAWRSGADLRELRVHDLQADPAAAMESAARTPQVRFSWPAAEPAGLREAADLPQWAEGFRLGSAGAARVNAFLDQPAAWVRAGDYAATRKLLGAGGEAFDCAPFFPVNLADPAAWRALLGRSSAPDPTGGGHRFPVQLMTDPADPAPSRVWSGGELAAAAQALAAEATLLPAASVAAFLDSGLLARALPGNAAEPADHALMPLRGWLRDAPAARARGAAWILHLAVQARHDHLESTRSARLWLLEKPPPDAPGFHIIRFEWTSPEDHLIPFRE